MLLDEPSSISTSIQTRQDSVGEFWAVAFLIYDQHLKLIDNLLPPKLFLMLRKDFQAAADVKVHPR